MNYRTSKIKSILEIFLEITKVEQSIAPIVLFVYNRLWHTQQTVEALQKNELAENSDLFIFADGAKNIEDSYAVDGVRKYLKTITGFKSITIEESPINKGLANAIIYGVTKIVNQFDKVIVLEDDLITSKYFLQYMNNNLVIYNNFDDVISIHGFVYPINDLPDAFFLRGADCWGWATWKRGWDIFEPDGQKLLNQLIENNSTKEFDYNHNYPFTQMLRDQMAGKNNSWAIRWHASAFLNNKLTLYPGKTLVKNIGFDNSGTHCGNCDLHNSIINESDHPVSKVLILENLTARKKFEKYFKATHYRGFIAITKTKLKKIVEILK